MENEILEIRAKLSVILDNQAYMMSQIHSLTDDQRKKQEEIKKGFNERIIRWMEKFKK